MVLKMIRFRSLKFRPRIATTLRPHGKWGDLIVCIIPVSWCANIITNSNFILRMIEWQSESGLLTVRIRGKQWYWVYKFELKTFTDVFTIPKNVGHNKWQISTPNDLQVADDYLHILQLRSQNRWVKSYWEDLSKEMNKSKDYHMILPKELILNSMGGPLGDKPYRFNSFSEMSIDNVIYTFDRRKMCDRLLNLLKVTKFNLPKDAIYASDFNNYLDKSAIESLISSSDKIKFILSDETLTDFLQILKNNKISKSNFYTLVKSGFSNSGEADSILYSFGLFDLSLNKPRSLDGDLEFDYTNLPLLRSYLNVMLSFNLNTKIVNFNLIYELDKFFNENFFKTVEDQAQAVSNVDSVESIKSDDVFVEDDLEASDDKYFSDLQKEDDYGYIVYKWKKSEFDEIQENLKKIRASLTPSDLVYGGFNFNNLKLSGEELTKLFGKKIWLNYDNNLSNLDFLIRLANKKSNWDESALTASFSESLNFFLTNDDIFQTRSDEVEQSDSFMKLADRSRPEAFYEDVAEDYTYSDFNEFDRNSRKSQGTVSPVRLIKYPISNKTNFDFSSDVVELFRFRFNEVDASTEHRLTPNSAFLIIRQKRYKRRKVILPRTVFYKNEDGNAGKKPKSANYTFLSQNSIILENDFNATKRYKFFKKNKMRDELTNLVLSKRILRTRRTLVLPAHLNITAITNSFDVIHSWFIPGLGLKMDAIPGRATHHTFYIDNVGFYYGQCAEICGRYHHHMPVRICALPFEHFLLWWQSFGLPKLLFTKNFRRYSYSYGSRKYAW